MSSIIGIDPGTNGAWSLLRADDGECYALDRIPAREHGWGGSTRYHVAPNEWLSRLRKELDGDELSVAVIERQTPQGGGKPNPAVSFSVGDSFGVSRAIVEALSCERVLLPRPQDWQPSVGGNERWSKDMSRALAALLHQHWHKSFSRGTDHDKADAALLATLGYRVLCGKSTITEDVDQRILEFIS